MGEEAKRGLEGSDFTLEYETLALFPEFPSPLVDVWLLSVLSSSEI